MLFRSVESTYFNIKQLSGVLTGGKNGFLISGTPYLKPGTEVLIELLDTNGNSIYVEAIKGYVEANARLIEIEVYEDTPPGTAILTVVGTAAINVSNGVQLSDSQTNQPNVRWQKKLIIEPRSNNKTPLRIKIQPQVLVEELLVTGSLLNTTPYNIGANFVLTPFIKDQKQSGYIIDNLTGVSFGSYQKSPILTGSLSVETRIYTDTIPPTTTSYQVVSSDNAVINLPVRLLNVSRAFADDNIVGYIDGNTINISPLLSGSYSVTSSAYSASEIGRAHV